MLVFYIFRPVFPFCVPYNAFSPLDKYKESKMETISLGHEVFWRCGLSVVVLISFVYLLILFGTYKTTPDSRCGYILLEIKGFTERLLSGILTAVLVSWFFFMSDVATQLKKDTGINFTGAEFNAMWLGMESKPQ